MDRKIGINSLKNVLSVEKNITAFEKAIFEVSNDENEYKDNLYQTIGLILNKKSLKDTISEIKKGKLGFNNSIFDDSRKTIEEFDQFLIKPFDITEGIIKCNKCGSMKTYSTSKTTRSLDEPTTTFSTCTICMHQWTSNG